ncbi:MAG: F-box protein [Candidatus Protochlamydia sp.]|nr:F-box protein [Candidatus Protochlamydia sp.]
MNTLPNECMYITLRFLDPQDLAVCCQVDKSWKEIASDDRLWKYFVPQDLAKTEIKNYVDTHAVTSYEDVLVRINSFCSQVLSSGNFYCHFPFNTDYSIFAELGIGDLTPYTRANPAHKETCVFLKKLPAHNQIKFATFTHTSEYELDLKNYYLKKITQLPCGIKGNFKFNLDIDQILHSQFDLLMNRKFS